MFALAGWVITLLLKRAVMIPFGPWLALGFVAALWLNRPAADSVSIYAAQLRENWRENPALIGMLAIIMVAGFVFAVVFAKLVRRAIERPTA